MHLLQMMQQAMKAAMKNMGGQPGQPGANPFGAGGMPGGMPPNMQGAMGQGWPPAVDTTARPAGQHNLKLCLQALLVRHMHSANATHACLEPVHSSGHFALHKGTTNKYASSCYASPHRQPVGCKRCLSVRLALHIQADCLALNAIASATRHECLFMPNAEGLTVNSRPPGLVCWHEVQSVVPAHLLRHTEKQLHTTCLLVIPQLI